MVHEIKNKAEFDSALAANKDKLVVIDFSATWVNNNLRYLRG
jgi:thiol:disulfide interchange protein